MNLGSYLTEAAFAGQPANGGVSHHQAQSNAAANFVLLSGGFTHMSEQTNTAVIQDLYSAFNTGDIHAILAKVDPNATWIDYGPAGVPYFGDFTGRISEFFGAIADSSTNGSIAIDRYVASDGTVVAEGRYTATVRSTGAKIDSPVVHIFTVQDGRVTSWKGYGDTAAVVAAHSGKAASA